MLKKAMAIVLLATGIGFGLASASFAQSVNGTVNSSIGSKGASAGIN